MNSFIILQNAKKYNEADENAFLDLRDIYLEIAEGESVAIVGKSGSGKTTLLRILAGLERPSAGSVMVGGDPLDQFSLKALTAYRRQKVGLILSESSVIPELTVYENIVLPFSLDGKQPQKEHIENLLVMMELTELYGVKAGKLRIDQQQKVAVARAYATNPSLILADEPTAHLHSEARGQLMQMLETCHERYGQTLVLATEDMDLAASFDRIIQLVDGSIANERRWGQ